MIIETALRGSMPLLSHAQFLSVRQFALEAWQSDTNAQGRELTPRLGDCPVREVRVLFRLEESVVVHV